MKKIILSLITVALIGLSVHVQAGVVVIVNQNNAEDLDKNTIRRIYLGKHTFFKSGSRIESVRPSEQAAGDLFNKNVLKLSNQQLRSHWARVIFTGKGRPPKKVKSSEEALKYVSKHENSIAFVDDSVVNDNVRIAYRVTR